MNRKSLLTLRTVTDIAAVSGGMVQLAIGYDGVLHHYTIVQALGRPVTLCERDVSLEPSDAEEPDCPLCLGFSERKLQSVAYEVRLANRALVAKTKATLKELGG